MAVGTQKLHARGPMGLEALTSYKWVLCRRLYFSPIICFIHKKPHSEKHQKCGYFLSCFSVYQMNFIAGNTIAQAIAPLIHTTTNVATLPNKAIRLIDNQRANDE